MSIIDFINKEEKVMLTRTGLIHCNEQLNVCIDIGFYNKKKRKEKERERERD